jgi:hypothetical protein
VRISVGEKLNERFLFEAMTRGCNDERHNGITSESQVLMR